MVALIAAGVSAVVLLKVTEPSEGDVYVRSVEDIMATPIGVMLRIEDADAADSVFDVFRDVDAAMSEWKDTSPLSAVNRAAGTSAIAVPADLRALLRRGIEVGRMTGGAFDISWAALWGLWDFRAPFPRVPEPEEVARRAADQVHAPASAR